MNTVWADRAGLHDALADVDDLQAFLANVDTYPGAAVTQGAVTQGAVTQGAVTQGHVGAARRLRDALRRLAATVTEDDRVHARSGLAEAEAVDAVNAALATAPHLQLRRSTGGWELGTAAGDAVDAVLAALARDGAELIADPARPLRACRAPGCVLFFVRDHPRREWCSVTCGNRVRAARHYRRLRTARS